ncbi:MAG TPA: N-acetylglucosamine-6-phosphate deacetylase [Anaerolineales bacterium]|nr:N-acetylglucosamine-6-phosphate deacetylase [Anaerolineales bacterium]
MEEVFAIEWVQLFEDGQVFPDSTLVIENERILYAGPQKGAPGLKGIRTIDGHGCSVAPGYIDLQINGGFGKDFTTEPGSMIEVAKLLPQTGVVSFLATFITSPLDSYSQKLLAVQAAQSIQAEDRASGARILGAHIEGPFLNPTTKGAHNQNLFQDPNDASLLFLHPLNAVRLLTLAPELPGALQAIRKLSSQGIKISIGHSNATFEEATAGIQAGAHYATHLYNAMRGMQHRDPGLVGTLLTSDEVTCGLIADGIHVHPRMVKLAFRALGPKRLTLVTDAMAAMGMPPGKFVIGDQDVKVDETTARLSDGTLAGSILRMDLAVRNMVDYCGCTPAQAARMASTTPAEVLGIDHETAHLRPGYRADFVLLDDHLNILKTYIGGQTS